MWEEIFNLAINNGLWAVLFLLLLIYVLKDTKNREQKYQDIIDNLGKSLSVINEVQQDVKEIKAKIESVSKRRNTRLQKNIEEIKGI